MVMGVDIEFNESIELASNESAELELILRLPASWMGVKESKALVLTVTREFSVRSEGLENEVSVSSEISLYSSGGLTALGINSPLGIGLAAGAVSILIAATALVVWSRFRRVRCLDIDEFAESNLESETIEAELF
jgi:hypothetical protein